MTVNSRPPTTDSPYRCDHGWPTVLREELPLLLWLVQMGMVLFWVYDGSPDRTRTQQLVRQAVPILDKLLRATRIPGVRGIADDVVVLVKSLVPPPH